MEIIDWNERVSQIKGLKMYIAKNTVTFVNNRHLQDLWGMLNRFLIDLNEKEIDVIITKMNTEIYGK